MRRDELAPSAAARARSRNSLTDRAQRLVLRLEGCGARGTSGALAGALNGSSRHRQAEPPRSGVDHNGNVPETETDPIPDPARTSPTPSQDEQDALEGLLTVLDLAPDPGGDPDTFVGQSQPQPWGRVFGGQVLAQSLVAAQRTVDDAEVGRARCTRCTATSCGPATPASRSSSRRAPA